MKNLFFTFLALILLMPLAWAQCPTGNLDLTSQQQIDNFAVQYPNCTEMTGLLRIGQSSGSLTNINNLSPLSSITSIGAISVERTNITDLNGLEGLQNIAADMKIILNPKLNTLNALNMTSVGGQLHVAYNKKLIDLEGLNQMTTLGSLRINNNNKLTDLSALMNLQTVSEVIIQNNQILSSLAGLNGVNPSTLNNVTITSNPLLSDCAINAICQYLGNQGANLIASNATS